LRWKEGKKKPRTKKLKELEVEIIEKKEIGKDRIEETKKMTEELEVAEVEVKEE
jgi:hypothetical protein